MTAELKIEGVEKTRKFLGRKQKQVENLTTEGLKKAAEFMRGEVKQSIAGRKAEPTSVDTGRFLNSVDFSVSKKFAKVFSDLSYAKFLEFGTSRLKRRKHFGNSLNRNKQNIRKIINSEIKRI